MSGSRFDKLERPRPAESERDEPQGSHGATLDRFGAQSPSARTPPEAAPGPEPAALQRFEADGAQGLRMERHSDEEQPFVRCPVCERDWGRFETRCGQCGEALDSPKARDFNRQLWAQRLAERQEESKGAAQRAEESQKQARELTEAKREMGRALARQVKNKYEAEHRSDGDASPLGPYWRPRATAALPVFIIAAIRTHGPMRWVFVALGAAVLAVDVFLWLRSD